MIEAVEAAAIDAISGAVPEGVRVMPYADASSAKDAASLLPAVFLIYGGHRIAKVIHGGWTATVRHRLIVLAAARDVRNRQSGTLAKASAYALAEACMQALMGLRVPGAATPLVPVDSPAAEYRAGISYVPVSFEFEQVVKRRGLDD